MDAGEVFPNSTVKDVYFQVTFPNLFYLDDHLAGQFQLGILGRFPKSQLVVQRQFLIASAESGKDLGEVPETGTRKIWKFESESTGYDLQLASDTLSLHSSHHNSYAHGDADRRFRDLIDFGLSSFLKVVQVPFFNRVGLRYVDSCPVRSRSTRTFRSWYNSCLPCKRFPVETLDTATVGVVRKLDAGYFLKYQERFAEESGILSLEIDIDAWHTQVKREDYLTTTDALHELCSEEFRTTAKTPLLEYMRSTSGK